MGKRNNTVEIKGSKFKCLLGRAWASPTLAWLRWARVCVSMLACLLGPTTYRKFQMSAFNILIFHDVHADVYFRAMRTSVKGYCQTAGSAWKRVRAKRIQVECVGSMYGNLLSELWWVWRSRGKACYEWQAAGCTLASGTRMTAHTCIAGIPLLAYGLTVKLRPCQCSCSSPAGRIAAACLCGHSNAICY